jgi:ribosome-associated translation inhibitor RaiA
MLIDIRSKDFTVTDAIHEHTRRRLNFALDSLARDRNFRRVIVRLGDLNGPKGGEDKFCRITAEMGHSAVVVEDIGSNLYSVVSRATRRFAQKASRQLARAYRLTARTRAADVVTA